MSTHAAQRPEQGITLLHRGKEAIIQASITRKQDITGLHRSQDKEAITTTGKIRGQDITPIAHHNAREVTCSHRNAHVNHIIPIRARAIPAPHHSVTALTSDLRAGHNTPHLKDNAPLRNSVITNQSPKKTINTGHAPATHKFDSQNPEQSFLKPPARGRRFFLALKTAA